MSGTAEDYLNVWLGLYPRIRRPEIRSTIGIFAINTRPGGKTTARCSGCRAFSTVLFNGYQFSVPSGQFFSEQISQLDRDRHHKWRYLKCPLKCPHLGRNRKFTCIEQIFDFCEKMLAK